MSLEDQLRRSFDDLDGAVAEVPVGRFEPPPDRSGQRVVATVALLLLGGLGVFWATRSGEVEQLDAAADPTTVPTSDVISPEPDPITVGATVAPDGLGEAYVPVNPGAGAWNADGSALLLYQRGGGYLVVGPDGSRIVELTIEAQDIEQVFWDPTDRAKIWFPRPDSNIMASVDAFTGQVADDTITVDGCSAIQASSEVGPNPTLLDDGRSVFGLRCDEPGANRLLMIDLQSGQQLGSHAISDDGSIVLSSSGRFGVVHTDGLLTVFDAGFENEMFSTELEPEFALIANAEVGEVAVGRRYGGELTGALVMIDLATGAERSIIGFDRGDGYPPAGLRMAASPGGVVALRVPTETDVDADNLLQSGNIYTLDLAETDPVLRLAAEAINSADNEDLGIWFRGYLSVNRSGTALGYSSDLATPSTDRVSTVIIPLGR
ncbi:MAG: hypothetical protein ACRBK7_23700 [Acidimicrobiales bacterium]